ncbi:MAG: M15 family metallopeptidase [Actinomycetia bacterium]|nr:M15 family metallopeptidase [Actinomycetes bacterium]
MRRARKTRGFFVILALAVIMIFLFNWGYPKVSEAGQRAIASLTGEPGPKAVSSQSSIVESDLMLVNDDNLLAYGFTPSDLLNLYALPWRSFELMEDSMYMKSDAAYAMQEMFDAAQNEGEFGFIITSAYRSYTEQTALYALNQSGSVARPGASEHHSGLAFDVGSLYNDAFEETGQYRWLIEHCADFGFILRFPAGKEDVTGRPFEPWHFRFVGTPYAQEIMSAGLTLEEYMEQ